MRFRTKLFAFCAPTFLLTTFFTAPLPSPQIPKEEHPLGANSYGAVIVDAIHGIGLVKLNGTNVVESLQVSGSLISQSAQIGLLEVQGEANLTDTVIRKGGNIIGHIKAHKTTFQQPLTILAQKAVFSASKLQAITFRKDFAYRGKQVLELKQGTIVEGPIVFESGKGEILLFSGSAVLGSVTGGKVIRKN